MSEDLTKIDLKSVSNADLVAELNERKAVSSIYFPSHDDGVNIVSSQGRIAFSGPAQVFIVQFKKEEL